MPQLPDQTEGGGEQGGEGRAQGQEEEDASRGTGTNGFFISLFCLSKLFEVL